ncbi:nucleoside monophosphate kinase [Candidatus Falkowbacteria bacterium]|nr:nucleoside monophosphate kinase [Candidatus Falkowbacteria bacterium]
MNFVLMGPQGSGKGTQGEMLAKKFKLPTVSAGALYRDNIKRKTRLGKLALKFTTKGVLGPNYITNNMMEAELKKPKYRVGVILDGYPRSLNQAKYLAKMRKIDLAILIDISQSETLKRLGGRRVCSKCGETYHVITKRPKIDMICDKCTGRLIKRADDYPEAIKQRLAVYRKETKPVIDYYKKQGKLIKINGQKPIKKVFSLILSEFKKRRVK